MELYQLRAFIAVASEGNLTRASELLGLSQPAVSAQIKGLESELGVVLFERTAHGMSITHAGSLLLVRAGEIADRALALSNLAAELSSQPPGAVKIGLNTEPLVLRVADLSMKVATQSPTVRLELVQAVSATVIEGVRRGYLDAGFVYGPFPADELRGIELKRGPFSVAGSSVAADRLRELDEERLLAEPWIWPPADCPFHPITESLFSTGRIVSNRVVTADHEATMLRLVAAGIGVCLLPSDMIVAASAFSGVAVVRETSLEIPLSFVVSKVRLPSKSTQIVFDMVASIWITG